MNDHFLYTTFCIFLFYHLTETQKTKSEQYIKNLGIIVSLGIIVTLILKKYDYLYLFHCLYILYLVYVTIISKNINTIKLNIAMLLTIILTRIYSSKCILLKTNYPSQVKINFNIIYVILLITCLVKLNIKNQYIQTSK